MPAGTVTQMPDASRLMSGLAACRRCVRARSGSAPGRANGPRGRVLTGPGSGALLAWGTDSCIFASPNQRWPRRSCSEQVQATRSCTLQAVQCVKSRLRVKMRKEDKYPCQAAKDKFDLKVINPRNVYCASPQHGGAMHVAGQHPAHPTLALTLLYCAEWKETYQQLAGLGCTHAGAHTRTQFEPTVERSGRLPATAGA